MNLEHFINQLKTSPDSIEFTDTISVIDTNYTFKETGFQNGSLSNNAGENNGSCKILAFAKLHSLSTEMTLACFGHYYRDEVLKDPQGTSHGNIRNLRDHGIKSVSFEAPPLTPLC